MRPKSSEPGRPVKRSKPMGKNLLANGVGATLTSSAPRLRLPESADFHRIPRWLGPRMSPAHWARSLLHCDMCK